MFVCDGYKKTEYIFGILAESHGKSNSPRVQFIYIYYVLCTNWRILENIFDRSVSLYIKLMKFKANIQRNALRVTITTCDYNIDLLCMLGPRGCSLRSLYYSSCIKFSDEKNHQTKAILSIQVCSVWWYCTTVGEEYCQRYIIS